VVGSFSAALHVVGTPPPVHADPRPLNLIACPQCVCTVGLERISCLAQSFMT